jgi:hypothetical protein
MAKIIVLSDTHGNHQFIRKVLMQSSDCDYIFHLGDNYEDLDDHPDLTESKIVLKVPGNNHPFYYNPRFLSTQTVSIHNWTFALTHTRNDFIKKQIKADIYLFGHTHQPVFFEQAGCFYLNPGHLKHYHDRGYEASYAVIEVSENEIAIKIYYLTGNLFFEKTLKKKNSITEAK